LEEFLVQSNPNQQFGSEDTETEEEDDETPYDPDKIRVDTKELFFASDLRYDNSGRH
jgi:hypothetical protein